MMHLYKLGENIGEHDLGEMTFELGEIYAGRVSATPYSTPVAWQLRGEMGRSITRGNGATNQAFALPVVFRR